MAPREEEKQLLEFHMNLQHLYPAYSSSAHVICPWAEQEYAGYESHGLPAALQALPSELGLLAGAIWKVCKAGCGRQLLKVPGQSL